jgi:hypothetical protein
MAVNPEALKRFLQPGPTLPALTQGSVGSHFHSTYGSTSSASGKPQQVAPTQRGEMKAFQTTFRGSANLLAPAPVPNLQRGSTSASAVVLSDKPPDVGSHGGRSLDDVWRKSLFSQAEGLADIDRTKVMKPDANGNVQVLRMQPDRFVMGRVLRPQVSLQVIPTSELHDDGARLMHPKERRAIHDAEVNSRQAYLALREAYKTRRKLTTNCAINYPHGVLGCSETPYASTGLTSDVYAEKASALVHDEVRAQRSGKARGAAHPHLPAATGLDVGTTETPSRPTGRAKRHVPRDTLDLRVQLQ